MHTNTKAPNYCNNIIEYSFYGIICAITFSISITEILSVVMIMAWGVKTLYERDFSFLKERPVQILLIFFMWVLLSCLNSSYFSESFRGVFSKTGKCALLFIIAFTSIRADEKIVKRFFYVILISSFIISLNGILQYITGFDLIRQRTLIPQDYMARVSSSFIHPNDFGIYLSMVLMVLISSIFYLKNKNHLIYFMSPAVIILMISLFMTRSRGAWLSFGVSMVILGALKSKRVFISFIIFLALLFAILPGSSKARMFNLVNFKSGTSWERVMLWRGTIEMIKVHPILGFGINTYSRNFPGYKPEGYPDLRYTHNCYLQMASEIGLPGLIFFLIFLSNALFTSLKALLKMPDGINKTLLAGLFAGLIGFYLNSMVDTHLFNVNLSVFSYLLLGFSLSLARRGYQFR